MVTKETIRRLVPYFVVVVATLPVAIYAYVSGVMAVALGMLLVLSGASVGLTRKAKVRRKVSI